MAEDNLLELFEKEKSLKIPAHIKNLLIFTGFDNKLSLSKMEMEDIAEIETLGRTVLPHIIPQSELDKYLGYFWNYPQGFCIFPGHKKILQELAQFYKNFSYKKRIFASDSSESARKRTEGGGAASADPLLDASPKASKPRDLETEKQNIYTLLTNWIINFCSRNLSYEEANHVNKELSKLKVDIIHEDTNQCFVTCCICLRELKIFRNQSGFWIMSNIHKHFKTHLNIYSNKKFSKNISITSSISNTMSQSNDSIIFVDNDANVKQEHELYDEN